MKTTLLTLSSLITMTVALYGQNNTINADLLMIVDKNPKEAEVAAFNTNVVNGKVELEWTITDNEPHAFMIEKSVNGRTFESAGIRVMDTGNKYSFTDIHPMSGVSYYRIMNIVRKATPNDREWVKEVTFVPATDLKMVVVDESYSQNAVNMELNN
jgi:hypothetical protein